MADPKDFQSWWDDLQYRSQVDALRSYDAALRKQAGETKHILPSVYSHRAEDLAEMVPTSSEEIEAWAQLRKNSKEREKKMCLLAIKAAQEQACIDDLDFLRQCGIAQDVCFL